MNRHNEVIEVDEKTCRRFFLVMIIVLVIAMVASTIIISSLQKTDKSVEYENIKS